MGLHSKRRKRLGYEKAQRLLGGLGEPARGDNRLAMTDEGGDTDLLPSFSDSLFNARFGEFSEYVTIAE